MSTTDDQVRITAFNSIFAALGVDPHSPDVTEEVRVMVHKGALQYARSCGYRFPEDPKQQRQSNPRTTRSSSSSDSGWTFRFGQRCKGKKPSEVDVKDLRWYEKVFRESIDDPEKARFRDSNQRDLEVVRAELTRRGEAANHD
jgi:hypothetical protein